MTKSNSFGTTPISPDELDGLKLTHITTTEQLNRFEQDNITEAMDWLSRRKPTKILNESFLKSLHQHMFGLVWKWAGKFRATDKNIGIPWQYIAVEVRKLCDDTQFQIDHQSYSPDEIAARFHHRLVQIHPFPNGNGRHSRLITDILLQNVLQKPPFTWGGAALRDADDPRRQYIGALQMADKGDMEALMKFVRS